MERKKFPEVLKAIENAKHHIHIEYYIFRDDEIGNTIENYFLKKLKKALKLDLFMMITEALKLEKLLAID